MFNLTAPANIRCNGVVNNASKTVPRIQRSPTSIPTLLNTSENQTIKYVDNKVSSASLSLSPNSVRPFILKKEPFDDPYAFNESEVLLLNNVKLNNIQSQPTSALLKKQLIKTENNIINSISTTSPNKNVYNNLVLSNNIVKSDVKQNDNCSKTMNKLQAQIARNKVNVKHKKERSPVPKDSSIIKNESDIINKPSIIDISDNNSSVRKLVTTSTFGVGNKSLPGHLKTRRVNLKTTHHEALQRIRKKREWHAPYQYGNICDAFSLSDTDSDSDENIMTIGNINRWITNGGSTIGIDREVQIQRNRDHMQRTLYKQKQGKFITNTNCYRTINLISAMQGTQCSQIANIILQQHSRFRDRLQLRSSSSGLLPPRQCSYDGVGAPCKQTALPCTRHCGRHIMHNSDQLLYDYCTAKFADNTQCCIPVFDLNHELPLCIEHARKRDNYNKMCQVVKPKKPRKKVKPSAMIRPQKRNKKRKRPPPKLNDKHTKVESKSTDINVAETSSACDSSDDLGLNTLAETTELSTQNHFGGDEPDDDMVAQVLGVGEELPLELVGPAEALVNQASRLLEETDLTNVFNQIPPDAFNDLFAIDRNGVYEPTREETEELERALEAVNQDVKSLEKMSQTQGILDSLLDEHALVESLAHMPDVFPNLNGFSVTSSVAQPSVSTVIPTRIHNLDNIMSVQPPAHMPS